jgi:transcriptional regulator with XRE-family HTH domain
VILRCHLREIRGKRPLSELEAETGINRGTLSHLERGRQLPLDKHVPDLERAYGAPRTEWYDPELLLIIEGDPE